MVKVRVNLDKVNNVWALLAVIAAGDVAICIYAIRPESPKYIGIVALILTIGLLILIVALIFKFIDKNPHLVRVDGKVDAQTSDFSNTFQQVDIDSLLSKLEEKKMMLIREEKWGELQNLELLFQNLLGISNRQNTDGASRTLREDRNKNLDKANSLLTDLLTQIRK